MILREIFLEGREAPLYHGAGLGGAMRIIEDNVFEARTHHIPKPGGFTEDVFGVSLTRSFEIARYFGDIIFVLDQRKLAYRYKIVPHDFWGLSKEPQVTGIGRRRGDYAEAEEFVIGPIEQADRYIISICVLARDLKTMKHRFPDSALLLFDHPLLKVL